MSERERINEVLDKASEWELHIIRIFVEGYAGKEDDKAADTVKALN